MIPEYWPGPEEEDPEKEPKSTPEESQATAAQALSGTNRGTGTKRFKTLIYRSGDQYESVSERAKRRNAELALKIDSGAKLLISLRFYALELVIGQYIKPRHVDLSRGKERWSWMRHRTAARRLLRLRSRRIEPFNPHKVEYRIRDDAWKLIQLSLGFRPGNQFTNFEFEIMGSRAELLFGKIDPQLEKLDQVAVKELLELLGEKALLAHTRAYLSDPYYEGQRRAELRKSTLPPLEEQPPANLGEYMKRFLKKPSDW